MKKLYSELDELQKNLDEWIEYYIFEQTYQGKMCCEQVPMETLEDEKSPWKKNISFKLNLTITAKKPVTVRSELTSD